MRERLVVPEPFSRVIIRFSKPMYIPPDLDEGEFEKKRLLPGQKMKELYEKTDRIWTGKDFI